ncbi:DUF3298 and DUF4163 domain-containing protein [Lysobacter sp. D1-1-M9]|uniref:DUF3298 and DUF4163 domain-containing protein n=1 Tax=Novilysobacter longmucuonensis TaxID=3098603 RepID=UPI002FCC7AB9
MKRAIILSLLTLAVSACDRAAPPGTPAPSATSATVTPTTADAMPNGEAGLEDLVESTSDYVIGISYPPVAAQHPGLAAELQRYADAARAELLAAVQAREPDGDGAMYDLSLAFTEVLDTPEVVAIAADGSSYTGGAHGMPLLARFVWLPRQERMLKATDLIRDPAGWQAVATHVREQLHTALSQRVDADQVEPGERAELVGNAGRMIDEGTRPDPANFSQFEPVAAPDGKLSALRFVFAPYQVGPYSDGVQTVQVPASVLLPHIAPDYRGLFQGA